MTVPSAPPGSRLRFDRSDDTGRFADLSTMQLGNYADVTSSLMDSLRPQYLLMLVLSTAGTVLGGLGMHLLNSRLRDTAELDFAELAQIATTLVVAGALGHAVLVVTMVDFDGPP